MRASSPPRTRSRDHETTTRAIRLVPIHDGSLDRHDASGPSGRLCGPSLPPVRIVGYGNDSRQTGPLSSRFLLIPCPTGFAFSLISRTRCPSLWADPALRVDQRALLFRPSRRSLTRRHARAEGEVRSRWPTDCEHDALGLDGVPVIAAEPEPTLAKRCADRLQRRNGPVCRESLPYPLMTIRGLSVDEAESLLLDTEFPADPFSR